LPAYDPDNSPPIYATPISGVYTTDIREALGAPREVDISMFEIYDTSVIIDDKEYTYLYDGEDGSINIGSGPYQLPTENFQVKELGFEETDNEEFSMDFNLDMKTAKLESKKRRKDNYDYKIAREYVLPDFTTLRRGYVRELKNQQDDMQSILLNNERFAVPELLFSPADVGIMQMGIPEAIAYSISKCDKSAHPWLFNNIVLTGGCCLFPNFKDRVEREVRELAPHLMEVSVRLPEDPIGYAWQGGVKLAKDECLGQISVSREEYLERGNAVCEERYYL